MSSHDTNLLTCWTGKVTMTRKYAMQAAKRGNRQDRNVRAYRCAKCGYWHVGHSNPSLNKKPPR